MNKFKGLGVVIAIIGFVMVSAVGVDLVTSRVGLGLIILGLAGLIFAMARLFDFSGDERDWLLGATALGGGYFVWRAFSAGPIGLAIPDITLVIVFLTTYLAVSGFGVKGRRFLIGCLAVLVVSHIVFAFAQEFGAKPFFVWKGNPQGVKLVTGMFGHYNPFAGFLNGSLFFFLTYVCLGKDSKLRILHGVVVVGILVALALSQSRGGWLALASGGAIWLVVLLTYLKFTKSRAFGGALAAGCLMAVLGIFAAIWAVQRISEKRAEAASERHNVEFSTEVDDGGRLAFQQLAFEIFQDSPVVGQGPRAYSYLSFEAWDRDSLALTSNPPDFVHNEYLQALSDYGALGLFLVLILVFLHGILGVYRAVTSMGERCDLTIWQIGAIGGFVAILSQCFFSFLLHVPALMALVGMQVGLLVSMTRGSEKVLPAEGRNLGLMSKSVAGLGVLVSALALAMGVPLVKAYTLAKKADQQLKYASDKDSLASALEIMSEAGDAGKDPKILEQVGRRAMKASFEAMKRNDGESAEKFNLLAKGAFERALDFNPHFAAGIAGLPRVNEALGNWEEADEGYKKAMEKLWSREYRLKPYFYGAYSSYRAGLKAYYENSKVEGLNHLREGAQRLAKRRELLTAVRELKDEKDLRLNLEGWTAFFEAELLFREGDRVWKKARPREPERAYALMLEAEKRFKLSESVVSDQDPRWRSQLKQVQLNFTYLEAGQVRPAKLTEEEIKLVLESEAVLDSPPATR